MYAIAKKDTLPCYVNANAGMITLIFFKFHPAMMYIWLVNFQFPNCLSDVAKNQWVNATHFKNVEQMSSKPADTLFGSF